MVMERLGMSLEEFLRIRRGKISLSMIKDISLQLLRKVVLLHSAGIIHNDIKPSNILFGVGDNRKKIYIIDYGLASLSSS
jgi:casein kinase 1 alpha